MANQRKALVLTDRTKLRKVDYLLELAQIGIETIPQSDWTNLKLDFPMLAVVDQLITEARHLIFTGEEL